MSSIADFLPLWGKWYLDGEPVKKKGPGSPFLGEGSFGAVWRIYCEDETGRDYAAVKHISIPYDDNEIENLLSEGIIDSQESAKSYYDHEKQMLRTEIGTMRKLRGYTNIVSYEDDLFLVKDNGIGYDLFLRMELLKPLDKVTTAMNPQEVVKLGIDIATAIETINRYGFVHRDIKPQNIFVNNTGDYKLGDFGTARTIKSSATTMSVKGTYNYMAPEIFNRQEAGNTVDIYSLGIVMYRLLNRNRLPFIQLEEKTTITSDMIEEAQTKRFSGKYRAAAPVDADQQLAEIVMKCCEFDPQDRWQTGTELKDALISYRMALIRKEKASINDNEHTIAEPRKATREMPSKIEINVAVQNTEQTVFESIDAQDLQENRKRRSSANTEEEEPNAQEADSKNSESVNEISTGTPEKQSDTKRKKNLWIIALAVGILVAGVGLIWKFTQPTTTDIATIAPEATTDQPEKVTETAEPEWATSETAAMTDEPEKETATPVKETERVTETPTQEPVTVITVPATDTPIPECIITWKDDAGQVIDTESVPYGTLPQHEDPVKESDELYSYTFNRWKPGIAEVTGDVTYEAQFTRARRMYNITWLDDEGKVIDETKLSAGSIPTHVEPQKERDEIYSYVFNGWSPAPEAIKSDVTYQATYKKNLLKYTITWRMDDDSLIDQETVSAGEMPKHSDPVKEADDKYTYTFVGWEPEIEKTTKNATYKAVFEAKRKSYQITWKDDEGNVIDTTNVLAGYYPVHVYPTKGEEGEYIFSGWTPKIVAAKEDTTYQATYVKNEKKKYTITWEDDEGNVIDTTNVLAGYYPVHVYPTKEEVGEYIFTGWSPEIVVASADATYRATYTKNKSEKWHCDNCGADNTFDNIFCINCGQTRVCLECGHSVPKANAFCENCGTAVGKWICENCGTIQDSLNTFCENCGTKRHEITVAK